MWKQLNFCGSRSTLKKEVGSGSNLLYTKLEVVFSLSPVLEQIVPEI